MKHSTPLTNNHEPMKRKFGSLSSVTSLVIKAFKKHDSGVSLRDFDCDTCETTDQQEIRSEQEAKCLSRDMGRRDMIMEGVKLAISHVANSPMPNEDIEINITLMKKRVNIKILEAKHFQKFWTQDAIQNMMQSFDGETGQYTIQTMTKREVRTALPIIPSYCSKFPTSFLLRYAMMLKIKINAKSTYVAVTTPILRDPIAETTYNLFGTTSGIKTERDFINDHPNFAYFAFRPRHVNLVLQVLSEDVAWLTKHGCKGYVFLVDFGEERWSGGITHLFYRESKVKRTKKAVVGRQVVSSEKYGRQFLGFLITHVFHPTQPSQK